MIKITDTLLILLLKPMKLLLTKYNLTKKFSTADRTHKNLKTTDNFITNLHKQYLKSENLTPKISTF